MNGKEKSKYRQTKQWKEFRKKLLEKKEYTCEICTIKKKKGLHIHHYDESTYGKEEDTNVIVLCSTCHKLVEWMLSRKRNKIDIESFCSKRIDVYNKSNK